MAQSADHLGERGSGHHPRPVCEREGVGASTFLCCSFQSVSAGRLVAVGPPASRNLRKGHVGDGGC
eukprot:7332929-Prymnesium_polylepis.1